MATVNLQLSEFNELCRLCGSKTSVLMGLHIFQREGNLRQIYEKIKACLPIQVVSNDKLPKMVCEECVYKLDALFEFRERSLKTEFVLHNMLKNLYIPACNDTLSLNMDTFCTVQDGSDGIHTQPAEVEIALDGNAEQLETIITIPLNHHESEDSIKCEPGLLLKTTDGGQHVTVSNVRPMSEGSSDSQQLQVEVEHTEPCSLSASLHSDLQITEIRSLQSLPNAANKTNEVERATSYIVTTSGDPLAGSEQDQAWYYCTVCGKPFTSSDAFEAHCQTHLLKCSECGTSCINKEKMLVHMRDVHQIEVRDSLIEENNAKKKVDGKKEGKGDQKECPECGKQYKTNYKLAEHMRKHTGEKPYKCSMCEKAFRSRIGLAQHEAKHTGHYDYNCVTCGKGFQCKSYLIVHQRVHSDLKPYPCETCGRNFKTKQSLLDHQNRHLGVKPYLCETCGRGFITKGLCKSHQKVHSGMDNRQYPCSVCNKLFVSKSYLTTHLRIHTGEKPFMCEVCGKGFLTRVDLRIHSTMHTGEKSFVCEVCGKAFARRDALRCHKRSHTGERPYKCDICGQGFTQFSPMAIHKRLHTGERPYSCDICLKGFVSRSTMMSHRKKHTI